MGSLFFYLVGISVTVSILVVLMLLLSSYLDERYPVKWRYFIWLILAIRLVIPFDLGFAPPLEVKLNDREISSRFEQNLNGTAAYSAAGAPEAENTIGAERNAATDQTVLPRGKALDGRAEPTGGHGADGEKALTVSRLVLWVYLAGIAAFCLWQLGLYLSFRFAARRWYRDVSNQKIWEIFDRLKTEMDIEKDFRIRICRKITSPMIAGLFKPTLLLPHEGYQSIDLEIILKHELVHFKRNDLWFKLLLIFANALHWFNPFIYVMVKKANQDIEISCDEEALRGADLSLRKRYSERILELMKGNRVQEAPVSTNFHGGKGMMKNRIRHIFDDREKKKGVASFFLVLILIFVFSACRFDVGPHRWEIPITMGTADAYGLDETGERANDPSDTKIEMPFDLDGNGTMETMFSFTAEDGGKDCFLNYHKEDGRTVTTRVFDGVEMGAGYSLQAANLDGTDSILFLAAIDYRGMPFGSGAWELYSWDGNRFLPVDMTPVTEGVQAEILEQSPGSDPVLALSFPEGRSKGEPGVSREVRKIPLTKYDEEGYRTWGQDAVNKIMTEMKFVSGETLEGRGAHSAPLLETTEIVFITLPNAAATVTRYYQYEQGEWIPVREDIE